MQRRGKQIKIYRTGRLQMLMWRHDESKVKYRELNYCRCQYAETRKAKSNIKK